MTAKRLSIIQTMTDPLPTLQTVPQFVAYCADNYAGNTAVIGEDGATLSYPALAEAVARTARAFIANGIVPGDRVAIWAPNSTEWIIATLGLQSAGAALVPLSTRLKGREASYILNKSGAKMLLTVNGFLGVDYQALLVDQRLPQLARTIIFNADSDAEQSWDKFLQEADTIDSKQLEQRQTQLDGEYLADIMFTSGTTGNPKGVMTSHSQNLATFANYSGVLGLHQGDRYLIINPFFHVFGYKAGWLSALLRGATIYPQAVFDAREAMERVAREKITILPGPPTLYQTLLALPDFAQYDLSSLRLAITGGAAVPVDLIKRMRSDIGIDIVLTGYGLTETSGLVSMCSPDDSPETIATSAGKPIPGIDVRIVDDAMHDLPPGNSGELLVRGYNVMKGYFEDPEQTATAITPDGWLHTGDEVVMDERGYLSITGRKKEMFIVGGFNCYPAEIENMLLEHPDIVQAAVIGIPDERMGEVAKAFIIPRAGATLTAEDVIEWSRGIMANYKVPRQVEIRAELPTTPSGKIQKFLLS